MPTESFSVNNDLVVGNATRPTLVLDESDHKTLLRICEIVLYLVLGTTVWLFLCMVLYGMQTGRWRKKAGSSSLNNGAVYIVCVLATGASITSLGITAVVHGISHFQEVRACTETEGAVEILYFTSMYLTYLFLWILQRRIYTHPYVKDRVNKCVNILSICLAPMLVSTLVVEAAIFLKSLGSLYEYSESFHSCVLKKEFREDAAAIIAANTVITLVAQVLMVAFILYPAFRAHFPAVDQISDGTETAESQEKFGTNYSCCKRFCVNTFRSAMLISPIHAHVQRAIRSAVIIFAATIVAMIIEFAAISPTLPSPVQRIPGYISGLVNAFCMVSTFSFASQILTACWPSCSTKRRTNRKRDIDEKEDCSFTQSREVAKIEEAEL